MTSDSEFKDLCISFHKYLILKGNLGPIKKSTPEAIETEFATFLTHRRNLFARNSKKLYVSLKRNRKKLNTHSSTKMIIVYEDLIKKALVDAVVQESQEVVSLINGSKERLLEYFEKL